MAHQYNDEDVATVMAITNSSKLAAINCLSQAKGDVGSAINIYYEPGQPNYDTMPDLAPAESGLSELPFGPEQNPGITIQSADELAPRTFDGAPSRPPSRSDNKSPREHRTRKSSVCLMPHEATMGSCWILCKTDIA